MFLGTAPAGATTIQAESKVGNTEFLQGNGNNATENIPDKIFDEDNLRACQVHIVQSFHYRIIFL